MKISTDATDDFGINKSEKSSESEEDSLVESQIESESEVKNKIQAVTTIAVGNWKVKAEKEIEKVLKLTGDSSLDYYLSLIDHGIKKRAKARTGEKSECYFKLYRYLAPLKYIAVFLYAIMIQFVRPRWCGELIETIEKKPELLEEKYKGWNNLYCNDENGTFTQWPTPKYPGHTIMPIETGPLLLILFMQYCKD